MNRVLFSDLLQPKLDVARVEEQGTYWSALQSLVAQHAGCPLDWVVRYNTTTIRRERQYDKSEQAITYYLFAALSLVTGDFQDVEKLRTLFAHAFAEPGPAESVAEHLKTHRWAGLRYEALMCPTGDHRKAIKANVGSIPIGYLREIAQKKSGVRFESPTRLDVFVGDQAALIYGKGGVGLGFEAKFTSDIDTHTTYSPHRNQIIRNVEVGHGRFAEFYFVLIAPRVFRDRRSRFYVYKMDEYRGAGGAEALRADSLTSPGGGVTAGWKRRLGFLSWEDLVGVLFTGDRPNFNHPDAGELGTFLRDRMLLL